MTVNPKPLSAADIAAQQMNEENTKLNKITPVIQERWKNMPSDKIIMEYYFTDGRISVDEYNPPKSILHTRRFCEDNKLDYEKIENEWLSYSEE